VIPVYAKTFLVESKEGKVKFTDLTSDPLITIVEIHQCYAEGSGIKTTVYYDTLKTLNDQEQIRLMSNILIAEECMDNPEFTQLKNQRSRELWLLAEKGVPSSVAKDIIILTGDEMKGIRRKVKKG
jgi:hypothetical protein